MFVRRLLEEQQTQAQQQHENARKAADRGVSAQRLLVAEQNRRRMEQALQELESNEVQQRKQNLAPDKLTAAPLLRKWHKQKVQAKARLTFEQDFLPGAAPTCQQGLPSFVDYGEVASPQQQQQPGVEQRPQSAAHRPATAADRALKLVQELERQRRAEAAAAAAEQQQQERAAGWSSATVSSVGAEESDVHVNDLITFIPPVRSPDGHQQPPTPSLAPGAALDAAAAAAMAAARAAGTGAGSEVSRSSTSLTDMLEGDQHTSTASVLQESAPSSSAMDSVGPSLLVSYGDSAAATSAAAAASASLRSSLQEQLQQEPGVPESSAGALTVSAYEASNGSTSSSGTSSAAAAAAAVQDRPAEDAGALLGGRDSLDAIIAAADEVLRQLPADMQAAAAARAAAAVVPAPRPQQQQQQQDAACEREPLRQSAASSSGLRVTAGQVPGQARPQGHPADSSAEAATILAELSALQQQLGLQVGKPWAVWLCNVALSWASSTCL
jgi:hypothetical protein